MALLRTILKKGIWILFITKVISATASDKVSIDSISIDPVTNEVILAWNPSNTPGIPYYIVHYKNLFIGTSFQLDTVQATDELIHKGLNPDYDPSQIAVEYRIQNSDSTFSEFVKSMLLSHTYDSCDTEIELNWSPYTHWEVSSYQIIDFNTRQVIATTSDTSYTIEELGSSIEYAYYIRAIGVNGSSSSSNSIRINTGRPDIPDNLSILSVSHNGNNQVEIHAIVEGNSLLSDYQLYRSTNNTMNGASLITDDYQVSGDTIIFSDGSIDVNTEYYYQIELKDACGLTALWSNIANNLILESTTNNYLVDLNWNEIFYFPLNTQKFTIHRVINNSTDQILGSTSTNNFSDNLESLLGMGLNNKICYYLTASELNVNRPEIQSSLSCIEVTPDIYVPVIITPNGDGLNDAFIPQFTFLPSEYHLQIFNRSGNVIFESKDPTEQWRADDYEQGTYAYKIVVRNDDFKLNKSGHVSLIK